MGYQREQWHSGLTYQQICENCKTVVRYTDYNLDYRPWYADGYVDCPTCKNHLRHHEKFAIDSPYAAPQAVAAPQTAPAPQPPVQEAAGFTEKFCPNCGNPFNDNHRFCSQCGCKRS